MVTSIAGSSVELHSSGLQPRLIDWEWGGGLEITPQVVPMLSHCGDHLPAATRHFGKCKKRQQIKLPLAWGGGSTYST